MTVKLSSQEAAKLILEVFPDSIVETGLQTVVIKSEDLLKVAGYLKDNPEMNFAQLNDISSIDHLDYFEVIYRFTSLEHNRSLALKVRCCDRSNPEVPSLIGLWKGADLMEREVFDLMGIKFSGHPNLKRIFLWEGFIGHPLRKDYLL
jgi:NADH-quinone oxidoreductase subunit C